MDRNKTTKPVSNYDRYISTNSGRSLLREHSLTEVATWRILGEDPNCDFGGSHHQPVLGYRVGQLSDVIREAVELEQFWKWGSGGNIEKITIYPANPDAAKKVIELKNRRAELELQLKKVNDELGDR